MATTVTDYWNNISALNIFNLHTHIHTHAFTHLQTHTWSHSPLISSTNVQLSFSPSLSVSFFLALCPSVLLSRTIRRGSIHHLSTSLGTTQWRRGGTKWGDIGLALSLLLSHTHTQTPIHHHQQQLLAMTANCFSCTYLWFAGLEGPFFFLVSVCTSMHIHVSMSVWVGLAC